MFDCQHKLSPVNPQKAKSCGQFWIWHCWHRSGTTIMSFSSHTQDTHYISVCADFYYFCIHLLASFAWSQSLDPTQIERKQNTAQSRFSSFLWGFDGKFQVEFSPFLCTQSLFNTWVHNSLNAISPEGKYLMFFVLNFPTKVFPLLLKLFQPFHLEKLWKL